MKYYITSYVPRINNEENSMYDNLLANIKNMIQLENSEEIDFKKIHMYLTEDDFDNFCNDEEKLNDCEKIYISSDILMTNHEKRILRDYNIEFLRRNIGFVAQEPILNSGTIEENITYGVDTYKKSDFEEVCKKAFRLWLKKEQTTPNPSKK